jgi:hypothetical protein
MRSSTYAAVALLFAAGSAVAQQPMTVPGRSQSPWQQSLDTASCYGYANQTSKVNMARESQAAPRDQVRETRQIAPPRPVEPPLPPGASGASAAVAASGASAAMPASAALAASGTALAAGASAPGAASGAAASGAAVASAASDGQYAELKMPPLPPPEPPMARYWRAYGECMQNKGYYVR